MRAPLCLLLLSVLCLALSCEGCEADPGTLDETSGDIQLSPARIDFPPSPLLQSTSAELSIVNPGDGPLEISRFDLFGLNSSNFLVNFRSLDLDPQESATVVVTFTPTTTELATAELHIIHPGVLSGTTVVPLSGSGQVECDTAPVTVYPDLDGDGFGDDNAAGSSACALGPDQALSQGDCDDSAPAVHAEAAEDCTNAIDDDCDGLTDADDLDCAPRPPTVCTDHDDCGLNDERSACPQLGVAGQLCMDLCRSDVECGDGRACRPMPGTLSLGYCDVAGALAEGESCSSTQDCAVGFCTEGTCRALCQSASDCPADRSCGVAYHDTADVGGSAGRRLTSACVPTVGERSVGESCLVDGTTDLDTSQCATDHCDLLPGIYGLSNDASCAPLCANSGDCPPSQVCGIVYTGLAEQPPIGTTGEGAGRYIDAVTGCYTAARFDGLSGYVVPPGTTPMGGSCDATDPEGRLVCRSFLCAQFAPIAGRCTDFCDDDNDCDTPQTPGWRCKVAELSHSSLFLQGVGLADIGKFTLVGVCSP